MILGGLRRLSLVDYPGKTAAVVFSVGCNFRCGWCHNPELVLPSEEATSYLSEDDFFSFLKTRVGKVEGVVVTGGEPTVHGDLLDFLARLKSLGFSVKLDTNGTRPAVLARAYKQNLLDFVAMDIKGPLARYADIVSAPVDTAKIAKSIRLIMKSGVPYEFRTTVVPSLLSASDFEQIGELVAGAERYAFQRFVPGVKLLDARFAAEPPPSDADFSHYQTILSRFVAECLVR